MSIDDDEADFSRVGKWFSGGGKGAARPRVAARIIKTLEERIALLDNPSPIGSALVGEHAG